MRKRWQRRLTSLAMTFVLSTATLATAPADEVAESYDIVVYGTTSAGVIAAVQAARMGMDVVLVGPHQHLGGVSSSGLGHTDSGRKSAVGGLSREFYHRIWLHYRKPEAWEYQSREDYIKHDHGLSAAANAAETMWNFEPHVAEAIFESYIRENQIPVFTNEWLNRKNGVSMRDGRIQAITMLSGKTFGGKMFIDATYEGDLMAAAGVSYTIGRESNDKYNETLNGVQKDENVHHHRFIKNVSPYKVPGDPQSGLVWGVHGGQTGNEGEGDRRVQAYCYRMCMTDVASNQVPFPKPEGYDESMYELLFRNFEAGDLRFPMHPSPMPNRKTDTNNNNAFSTDAIGLNYGYPAASYEERKEILARHEKYQKGLMWTLANHPRIPEEIRQRMAKWGLAKDEFEENGHWPYQIYVREARRMIGPYVQTERDCRRLRICTDSIGLGSYNMDSHNVQRYVTQKGYVQNEGDVQVNPGGTYAISYRAITPKKDEAENLLVPVCLSSSHIAYGSIRMEPVFMILGQSAATAAALAIARDVAVQDLPYKVLKEQLLADGQQLEPSGAPRPVRKLSSESLPGIVIDDTDAKLTGSWLPSTSQGRWVERSYRHDDDSAKGEKTAIFTAQLAPGIYEVRLSYSPGPNRASQVPMRIHHAGGTATFDINQRKTPAIDGLFVSLGSYRFEGTGRVEIRNDQTDGYVIIDAVQFLPTGKAGAATN